LGSDRVPLRLGQIAQDDRFPKQRSGTMMVLHRRLRVGPVALLGTRVPRARSCKKSGVNHDNEESSRVKRQNTVSAHLRTNLPRDHSAAHTHSDTASFVMFRKARSGLTNPQREKQISYRSL